MSKDFDYIKNRFDSDGIRTPDSLSEEKMLDMLENAGSSEDVKEFIPAEAVPVAGKSYGRVKKWIALAACAMIAVIGGVPVYNHIVGPPDTGLVNGELYTFRNYREIERLVRDVDGSSGGRLFKLGGQNGVMTDGAEPEMVEDVDLSEEAPAASEPGSAVMSNSASGDSSAKSLAAPDHSSTYLQVEEVDEADIVKTDGKYIYYVNQNEEVVILSANKGKTKKLATIGNTDIENYIHDIYLKGDKLITIGVMYDDEESYSGAAVYDISDRKKPKLIDSFSQTGYIVSSRMVGDYVYLVTEDYVYNGGRVVPKCTANGKLANIPASDICSVPEPGRTSYAILSAIDTSSGKQGKSRTKAIFGATENIYCNDHNLYIAAGEWNEKYDSIYTRIARAGIDGLNIKFEATGTVRGYIDNQFSMDEKDGNFRIATTAQRDGMDVNNLFVLDSSLKEVGKVTGFARNESIRAVRYFGDKAYVITYKAIDPLFVIDLSDPAEPRIEGEVKIDGFSTLLVPVGKGRLLGIGHATGDNGYGGEYAAGLKLALFDISDPSEPKVIDSREFKDMNSPAQDSHKALTVNTKEGWFAIPYEVWTDVIDEDDTDDIEIIEDAEEPENDDSDVEEPEVEDLDEDEIIDYDDYSRNGVLVFSADDKIDVMDEHDLGGSYIYRCVYIDDYIYALDSEGDTESFRVRK